MGKLIWDFFFGTEEVIFFLKPKVINRKILTISFDDFEIVDSMQELALSDENKHFHFDKDSTQTDDKKLNIFKEIFSNVGQVRAQ
jgi:outer membrane protein assembly factor BamE (lipoprotein component of BamABCDE complex)